MCYSDGMTEQNADQGCLSLPNASPAGPVRTVFVAAAALVDIDHRVLIAERPAGKSLAGLWEFPGGKVDAFTFASHLYDDFHLLMPLYLCRVWRGTPEGREGQRLAWVRPNRLSEYPMPPADIPLVAMLRDFL